MDNYIPPNIISRNMSTLDNHLDYLEKLLDQHKK